MFQLAAHATAAPQAAQASDGVTNFFLMLAVGAFVVVLLRLVHAGELAGVITAVGGVITAVVVITVVALLIFVALVGVHSLLTI
jgi:hypothetical protein